MAAQTEPHAGRSSIARMVTKAMAEERRSCRVRMKGIGRSGLSFVSASADRCRHEFTRFADWSAHFFVRGGAKKWAARVEVRYQSEVLRFAQDDNGFGL